MLQLLRTALLAFFLCPLGTPAALKIERQPARLIILRGSHNHWIPLATFMMETNARPYLHPVYDATGQVVLTENKPPDHPWQHGIFTGFHRVNGLNYWKEDEGQQRFVRLLDMKESSNSVSWRALVEWVATDGHVVLEEEDRITIHEPESENGYAIDFDFRLRPKNDEVKFGKFFVGGLAVRMPWDKENPLQKHLNSNGIRDRACEQKRANWCNVERPFETEVHGIVVFDHPKNPGFPSPWRVDEQGLINPNVSGLSDWSIAPGDDRLFRYRLRIYRGTATLPQLWKQFEEFSAR